MRSRAFVISVHSRETTRVDGALISWRVLIARGNVTSAIHLRPVCVLNRVRTSRGDSRARQRRFSSRLIMKIIEIRKRRPEGKEPNAGLADGNNSQTLKRRR